MNKEKDDATKDEYILEVNENKEKVIKRLERKNGKDINMIFENETDTDVMTEVLNQLSKFYIEDILKLVN